MSSVSTQKETFPGNENIISTGKEWKEEAEDIRNIWKKGVVCSFHLKKIHNKTTNTTKKPNHNHQDCPAKCSLREHFQEQLN